MSLCFAEKLSKIGRALETICQIGLDSVYEQEQDSEGIVSIAGLLINCDQISSPEDLLLKSIKNNKIFAVILLLKFDFDIEVQEPVTLRSPLHISASKGYIEITQILINKKANLNLKDKQGFTPLHLAVRMKHFKTIEILVEHGATLEHPTEMDLKTLADASMKRNMLPIFREMKNLWLPTKDQLTFVSRIHGAMGTSLIEIFDVEVDHSQYNHWLKARGPKLCKIMNKLRGKDVNLKDNAGYTVLHFAAQKNHRDMAKVLLANGSDLNSLDKNQQSPIFLSVIFGSVEVTEILLRHKANIELRDHIGWMPIHYAISKNHKEIVQLLINYGADMNEHISHLSNHWPTLTPLYMASFKGLPDIVQILIENGACVDGRIRNLETPLIGATCKNHIDICKILLLYGADVSASDEVNKTALYIATYYGHERIVKLLIENGANIHAKLTEKQVTPLFWPVIKGFLKVCEMLILEGADVNAKDIHRQVPLHFAIEHRRTDIVKLLLATGASLNIKSLFSGNTPLEINFKRKDINMLKNVLSVKTEL